MRNYRHNPEVGVFWLFTLAGLSIAACAIATVLALAGRLPL